MSISAVLRLPALLISLSASGCGIEMYGTYDDYDHLSTYRIPIEMPASAPFISQQFRPPSEQGPGAHDGVDFWGALRTPILAAAPGRVIASFYEPKYGNRIVIDHGVDSDGERVHTVYKHLKERLVSVGDTVARGQQIGSMGATGLLGMMVHLHFEVRRIGADNYDTPYDPQLFWINGPGRITCFDPAAHYPDRPFRTTLPVACKKQP